MRDARAIVQSIGSDRDMSVWNGRVAILLGCPLLGGFGYRQRANTGESDA